MEAHNRTNKKIALTPNMEGEATDNQIIPPGGILIVDQLMPRLQIFFVDTPSGLRVVVRQEGLIIPSEHRN